jgi:hypothetical protein
MLIDVFLKHMTQKVVSEDYLFDESAIKWEINEHIVEKLLHC